MSHQAELNSYIARLVQRLRLLASLRGAAIFTGTALLVTVALVLVLNKYAFPTGGVTVSRYALVLALAAAAGLGLLLPLLQVTRSRAVRAAEQAHPEFEERLTTFQERQAQSADPFLELLAADTLAQTKDAPPVSFAPASHLFACAGAGLASLGVLAWIIAAGPGYLGYGASLLWTGARHAAPLYAIAVKPGDVAVRRHSDQVVIAQVTGLRPEKVQLFAHYQSAAGWEPVSMQSTQAQSDAGSAGSYQFAFTGLPEDVEYYVAAGPLVSPHYKVHVVDLPSVKSIRVTYHYPRWTRMHAVTEEHAGDLRAIEGTDASVEIEMDRPLQNTKAALLSLNEGKTLPLTAGGNNRYLATIHMDKDGAYHVATVEAGQPVRLSEDYFIATDKATPPEVALDRPGRDYRASPIEEVKVQVKAADAYGLEDVHLHYSVNGGADRDISMLKAPGAKSADGAYTLRLEDFKLVPGDLVSLYATAKDGHAEARTDITFIQADPFEREFSQSQQAGGQGGSGSGKESQTEISKREKELIAATWKQQNDKAATPKDAAAQGQFLADAQSKLRDQVLALSARMQSRDLSGANEEFTGFEKDIEVAAGAMAPSADKLKGMAWKDAMPFEQKALQALLRAEATFRKIQVAFGQQQGGGGGGGSSAGRDLASLFDLELDTEKNQYETAQTASPEQQHAKDVESALEKLDALAKRQEELASQQQKPQQSFEERWQQEMLRREAEQLQQQLQQLAQKNQGDQGQQGSQSNASANASSGSPRKSPNQSGGQSGGESGSQAGAQPSSSSASGSSSGQQRDSSEGSVAAQGGSATRRHQSGQRPGNSAARSQDQRIEQAMDSLRQATEAMKRSTGSTGSQGSSDAAQRAAERLQAATSQLGGAQQQLASGTVGALAQKADQLAQEERAQAERIDKLTHGQTSAVSSGGPSSGPTGAGRLGGSTEGLDSAGMMARLRARDQLAAERQQLSNDLSALQKGLRDTARDIAPTQPAAAQKLRDSLTAMDESDLDNHVQRTADWLRRGINPNVNGTEGEIAEGLQKLDQQLRQVQEQVQDKAQQGVGQNKPGQEGPGRRSGQLGGAGGEETAELDAARNKVEQLRSQLEAMTASRGSGNGQQSQPGSPSTSHSAAAMGRQSASAKGSAGQRSGSGQQSASGDQPGERTEDRGGNGQQGMQRAGNAAGASGSSAQSGASGSSTGRLTGQRSGNGLNATGDLGGHSGATRNGGGDPDSFVRGNLNTGDNHYGQATQRPVPLDASGNPADTERSYQQSMRESARELSQLKQMVRNDPQAAQQIRELSRQMQQLDPSRFPGNPAMVAKMHQDLLSAVDRLELQLDRDGSTAARTGKPDSIPAGYQESIAEYYRRLSGKNQ